MRNKLNALASERNEGEGEHESQPPPPPSSNVFHRPAVHEIESNHTMSLSLTSLTLTDIDDDASLSPFRIVYGAFAGVCLLGNLIFVLIPTKNVQNSIAARFGKARVGFVDQMRMLFLKVNPWKWVKIRQNMGQNSQKLSTTVH